jgi:hypothetical protein
MCEPMDTLIAKLALGQPNFNVKDNNLKKHSYIYVEYMSMFDLASAQIKLSIEITLVHN